MNVNNQLKIEFITESAWNALSSSEQASTTYRILKQLIDNQNKQIDGEIDNEM